MVCWTLSAMDYLTNGIVEKAPREKRSNSVTQVKRKHSFAALTRRTFLSGSQSLNSSPNKIEQTPKSPKPGKKHKATRDVLQPERSHSKWYAYTPTPFSKEEKCVSHVEIPKKGPATSTNNTRHQSMMITSKLTNYSNSLSKNGASSFPGDGNKIHAIPVRPNVSRPISSYETGKSSEHSVAEGKYLRASYRDEVDSHSLHSGSRTPPQLSQYSNNVSDSTESLDEAVDLAELENDPDLMIKEDEPEAWSVTVDRKLLNKMQKKDIRRQDNIFEFIQKERNFLTALKIMQKIFAIGMSRELQFDQETIENMFPQIDEFVEFTSNFVQMLDDRQREAQVVSRIGDVLVTQWSGESGRQMLWLFSEFCSRQADIVSSYKDLMKSDKKFQDFIRKCGKNPLTRRRDIPGCILLVTQRITKYPVILKTVIDNSARKEHKSDCADLKAALELVTDIIKKVDKQVLEYEKCKKITDIHAKMESKSYATYKDGRKFTRDDFYHSMQKLLQVGALQWKPSTVKRPIDVTLVLFKDLLVFVQESNQRYSFASVGQPAAVPLHKLIVREKAGEDSVLFLISASSDKPEMYELEFQTPSVSKSWMQWIRAAADICPEEDEGVAYQDVEEQKVMEQKWVQAKELITELENRDKEINVALQDKMKKFKKLATVFERPEVTANMKFGYPTYILDTDNLDSTKAPAGAPTLQKAVEQVNKLAHAVCGPGGLNRNPSSVGEHDSGSCQTPSLPKRSETFGGFDNGREPPSPRAKWSNMGPKISPKQDVESRLGSGHLAGESISGCSSSSDSSPVATVLRGQGGMILPPTSDQVTALAQLTHLLNEYLSIAIQQDTQVQKMTLKMMQAQSRRGNGDRFLEVEARRNQAKQTETEQDLTKREEALKIDRDQWNRQYKRFQASMDSEKAEMEDRLLKLKQDEIEVDRQREEVKIAKDECQKQMARLREVQRKASYQDSGITQSASYPSSLSAANKNNSNNHSSDDAADKVDDYQGTLRSKISPLAGERLNAMLASLSKSHSSLEEETSSSSSGDNAASRELPTYTSAGDYPKTFPGTGKRDQTSGFLTQPVQPPVSTPLPIHLQYSATNQLSGNVAPPRHGVIPSNLTSKSKHVSQQVLPTKLKRATLSGAHSSQSSTKQTFTDGIKSKLPFSHHKKASRSTGSSSDLNDAKARSLTLSVPPGNMKHARSEAAMDLANGRHRATSSPSHVVSFYPPDSESGLERCNSASSNSSKEGTEKRGKKGKRRSWGSTSVGEKPNEKEIYF